MSSTLRKPKPVKIPKLKPQPFRHSRTTKDLLERLEDEQKKRKKKKKKK